MTGNPNKKELINKKETPSRLGDKIRETRVALGWKQGDLGEKVGLTADRIQKYENGVRKPKEELLEKIAKAMGVEVEALQEPVIASDIGAMFALFELEELHGLRMRKSHGKNILVFGDGIEGILNEYISDWIKKRESIERSIQDENISDDEKKEILESYKLWKMRFPRSSEEEKARREQAYKDTLEEKLRQVREKWQY